MALSAPNNVVVHINGKIIKGAVVEIHQDTEYVSSIGGRVIPGPVYFDVRFVETGTIDIPSDKDWKLEDFLEQEYGPSF